MNPYSKSKALNCLTTNEIIHFWPLLTFITDYGIKIQILDKRSTILSIEPVARSCTKVE